MSLCKTPDTFLWSRIKKRLQITNEKSKKQREIPKKINPVKVSKVSEYLSKRMMTKTKRKFPAHKEKHLYCVLDALITLNKLDAAWDLVVSCQQYRIKLVPQSVNSLLWACIESSDGNRSDRFLKVWDIVLKTNILTYDAFASKICYHSEHSQLEEIRKLLSQMEKKDYFPQFIVRRSLMTTTQSKRVTDALAKVDPELVQISPPHQQAKLPPIVSEFYSKEKPVIQGTNNDCQTYILSADELSAQLETHLELERATYVNIPSIVSSNLATKSQVIREMRESKSNLFKKTLQTWRNELSAAVREEQEEVIRELDLPRRATGRSPVVPRGTLFLCLLPPEIWADILIHKVALPILSFGVGGISSFQLTNEIGRTAWHHYVIRKKDSSGLFPQLSVIYTEYMKLFTDPLISQKYTPREYWEILMEKYTNSLDIPYATWPYSIIDAIAFHLLYLFVNKLSMPRLDTEPIHKSGKPFFYVLKHSTHEPGVIVPDDKLVRFYKIVSKVHQESVHISTFDLPTLVPPRPWSSFRDGGLLCLPTFLVRVRDEGSHQEILEGGNNLRGVFDSLNILGNCPWRINQPILDEVITIFRAGGSAKLGIPVVPWKLKDIPKWNPDLTPKEFFLLKLSHKLDKKERAEAHSLYMDMLYRLSVSDKIRDQVFWLPHFLDFRGRAYPMSSTLSHMCGDVQRGMMKFAIGKPLGPKGLDWLKIHLINLTGLFKRSSLVGRLKEADNLIDQIIESANSPMEGDKWWRSMEEPWEILAICREIRDAILSGDPENFVSHIPVHQDGSCNGLQHYAAMGRDPIGAQSVNLTPSPSPADVYSEVAAHVEKFRVEDAKNGHKLAQKLEGMISRRVVKQPVMTEVYGVTFIGARLQVETQLREMCDWPKRELFDASVYIVQLLIKSMNEMFQKAKAIQNWFARSAHLISKHYPVEWETPLGLICTQPYHKPSVQRITTKLQKALNITYQSEVTNKPDTFKQRNGFPPNFVHSLDSAHMMLTSLHCQREGVTFVSVHDSYWTHAATVDQMGRILREQFILLHSQPILENLSNHFLEVFGEKLNEETISFLKNIPAKGNFDISQITGSEYFFS